MASLVTTGLSKIEIATILGDGSTGTTWATIGYTYEDSCKLTSEDPSTKEFYAEETDAAVATISKAGKVTLTFSLMDCDPDALVTVFGGTATGTTPKTWNAPASIPTIEKSIKITPKSGLTIVIPRASITAKFNSQFGRNNLFLVDITGTVLAPTKAGLASIQATG